jgi:diguanylate cyclase (GGDEF)-like protein
MLGIAAYITTKEATEMRGLLEDSIKTQLISTSLAATELIDEDRFVTYNSIEDTENSFYDETLAKLRRLCTTVGAKYIYALKIIDGKCYFIFDTDPEEDTRFKEYEIFDVHKRAFDGERVADVMNVADEYGSFNTGAVPLYRDGEIVGIVSTDIEDTLIAESHETGKQYTILMVIALLATMAILGVAMLLMRRLWVMHDESHHSSRHDAITGLPNRRYLMDHLGSITKGSEEFALIFVDLDNFKQVNDTCGHDAGDDLLKHFAEYLETALYETISFRPAPGKLSLSARIGGDEFIQVVAGVETEADAEVVAKKLLDGFSGINDPCIGKCNVGMSIGVALCPKHTDNPHILLKYADEAMYEAKKAGKNRYRIYTPA